MKSSLGFRCYKCDFVNLKYPRIMNDTLTKEELKSIDEYNRKESGEWD